MFRAVWQPPDRYWPNGQPATDSYLYDAAGLHVQQTLNGSVTSYALDADQILGNVRGAAIASSAPPRAPS